MSDNNRLMFISGIISEKDMTRVMDDKGSVLNILPKTNPLTTGLTLGHLIQGLNQSEQCLLGKI